MIKKKALKKSLAMTLSLAMAFSMTNFGMVNGITLKDSINVSAATDTLLKSSDVETDEPQYDANENVMLYEKDILNVKNGITSKFDDIGVSASDTYYITYTLKTQGETYFTYRGTKIGEQGQVYIGAKQYGLTGLKNEIWPQIPGLAEASEGVRITVKSTPEASTIYVNGEKVADNEELKTKNEVGIPSIFASGADAVIKNIKIWKMSDVPIYDESTDDSVFNRDKIEISAQTKNSFDITVPAFVEYYSNYDITTNGGVYILLRGEKEECRFYIDDHQYALLGGSDTEEWKQKKTGLDVGAKITIACAGDKVRVWLNGEKIIDEAMTKNTGLKAYPGIVWVTEDTTVTNARVWVKGDAVLTNDPKYDETKDILKASKEEINIAAQSKADLGVEIPSYQEYYMDFTVQSDSGVYISFRGNDFGRLYIAPTQYAVIGVSEEPEWVQRTINLKDGVRITVQSSGKKVSVWLDGENIVKDAELIKSGEIGSPSISWATSATKISNLKVWTNNDTYSEKFNWSADYSTAKVTITNTNDESQSYVYDAVVTKKEKKKATCTEKGLSIYTATYGEFSDKKEVETEARGHNYKVTFNWALDYKSAKVTVTCLNDTSDTKTYDANITANITAKATYFKKGVTTYTATYDKYVDSKVVSDIPQLKLGNTKVTVKSPKKKRLKVSLKKVTGATGYEIQYSLKKNFKGAKKVTIKKTSYTIKKLKSKKKYYVRVRTFTTSGNKKVYGAWMRVKKAVKVK